MRTASITAVVIFAVCLVISFILKNEFAFITFIAFFPAALGAVHLLKSAFR